MYISRTPFALVLALLLAGSTLAADTPIEIADRIDAYVGPFVEIGHLSGSLLVVRAGTTVYESSFGLADRELEVASTAETRFCIASITKPMTQIIALRLLAAGLVGLEDPVSKWIADFPRGDEITLEMLAYHRAGIPHRLTEPDQETVPRSAADMVELARRAGFDFPPGEETSYSSGGYSILARILELATQKSYSELLEEHVFAPAGMTDSIHPSGYEIIPQRASSYQFSGDGRLVNTPLKHYSFLVGAGSVFSTARDLVRMMQSLVGGAYGELARQELLDDEGIDWAGRTNGYQAFADYDTETDIYIVFTGNVSSGAVAWLREDLPRIVTGEPLEPRTPPSFDPFEVPASVLERYTGTYVLGSSQELEMRVVARRLRIGDWLLIPMSETTFFSPQDYGRIEVVLDDDDSPVRLDWTIGDTVYPMPRVEP